MSDLGSYQRGYTIDTVTGVKTYYDGPSSYDSHMARLRAETRKLEQLGMDPHERTVRYEGYMDDRMNDHIRQYHEKHGRYALSKTPTKTLEQYDDEVVDVKEELRGDKLILRILFVLGFLGVFMVLGSTFLIIISVLTGFWGCTLPVVVGFALTICLFLAFQGVHELNDTRKKLRIAQRAKRDFETAEEARLVAEYEADRARGGA